MSSQFRRPLIPAHLLPLFSPSHQRSFSDSASITSAAFSASGMSATSTLSQSTTLNHSITGSLPGVDFLGLQGDLSRLTNTLRAVVEVGDPCWRGDECELSSGVRTGLEQVASHFGRHSELSESRVRYSP